MIPKQIFINIDEPMFSDEYGEKNGQEYQASIKRYLETDIEYIRADALLADAKFRIDKLEAELLDMTANAELERLQLVAANKRIENLWAALGVLLDSVDYTSGACKLNEAVGAVLPIEIIEKAKAALKASND